MAEDFTKEKEILAIKDCERRNEVEVKLRWRGLGVGVDEKNDIFCGFLCGCGTEFQRMGKVTEFVVCQLTA